MGTWLIALLIGWYSEVCLLTRVCSQLAGFQKQGTVTDRLACRNTLTDESCLKGVKVGSYSMPVELSGII